MNYTVQRMWTERSRSTKEEWEKLLSAAGIRSEEQIEYTVGIYDGEKLVATGSRHQNVLKCIAVCRDYTGGEVISLLVSHLMTEVFDAGFVSCYVYTKPESVMSFVYMGFQEIERVGDDLVFLEKAVHGFSEFLEKLSTKKVEAKSISGIVMNANPFTKGHQYLIETAAAQSDVLHVFVLSEDLSAFPSKVRMDLVRKGTEHLPNVMIHETGDYMVSAKTFPSYFLKEDKDVTKIQASLDAKIFKNHIAKVLGITTRFVGEEPISFATDIYNQAMKEVFGSEMELVIIKRMEFGGEVISASRVRAYLKEDRVLELKGLVPETTYEYLVSEEGRKIQEKLKSEDQ
ncbi:MAG TPA: [citrate (pro-3S)-lyase] ligase [Bacteroidales bacterium]|nr:[citrate (pro-3S)-lyase] ligase [Bacteroidales bacterium]